MNHDEYGDYIAKGVLTVRNVGERIRFKRNQNMSFRILPDYTKEVECEELNLSLRGRMWADVFRDMERQLDRAWATYVLADPDSNYAKDAYSKVLLQAIEYI